MPPAHFFPFARALSTLHSSHPSLFPPPTGTINPPQFPSLAFSTSHWHYQPSTVPIPRFFHLARALSTFHSSRPSLFPPHTGTINPPQFPSLAFSTSHRHYQPSTVPVPRFFHLPLALSTFHSSRPSLFPPHTGTINPPQFPSLAFSTSHRHYQPSTVPVPRFFHLPLALSTFHSSRPSLFPPHTGTINPPQFPSLAFSTSHRHYQPSTVPVPRFFHLPLALSTFHSSRPSLFPPHTGTINPPQFPSLAFSTSHRHYQPSTVPVPRFFHLPLALSTFHSSRPSLFPPHTGTINPPQFPSLAFSTSHRHYQPSTVPVPRFFHLPLALSTFHSSRPSLFPPHTGTINPPQFPSLAFSTSHRHYQPSTVPVPRFFHLPLALSTFHSSRPSLFPPPTGTINLP